MCIKTYIYIYIERERERERERTKQKKNQPITLEITGIRVYTHVENTYLYIKRIYIDLLNKIEINCKSIHFNIYIYIYIYIYIVEFYGSCLLTW